MGCRVDLTKILEVLKKPVAPVVGFLAQFGLMPLVGWVQTCAADAHLGGGKTTFSFIKQNNLLLTT